MMKKSVSALLCASMLMPATLLAADPVPATRASIQITLQGEASLTVPNDEAVIVFSAEHQAKTPSEATDEVVRRGNGAVEALKGFGSGIEAETTGLTANPVYTRAPEGGVSEIGAWQARETIRVTVRDVKRVSAVLAAVSPHMAYDGITFRVSDEAQRKRRDELIRTAVADALRQAGAVADSLGRRADELSVASVRVGAHGDGGRRYYAAPMMAADNRGGVGSVPAVSAGTADLSLTVNVALELAR